MKHNDGSIVAIKPKCSMIINQNLHSSRDPIGPCCTNDAVAHDGVHFYCKKCLKNLDGDNPFYKVTKPPYADVPGWNDRIKRVVSSLLDSNNWIVSINAHMNKMNISKE